MYSAGQTEKFRGSDEMRHEALPIRPVRVTCTLIVFNEVDRVRRAIESVAGIADEVIVVDSGSTDGTVELCESLGAKVIYNPWVGFGPQKRRAEDEASHDWILNLDADEWLSDALREELKTILSKPIPPTRSFLMRVRLVYPKRDTPAPFASFHNYVRLYNRTTTRFRDSLAHDVVPATEDVVQVENDVHHRSFRDIAHVIIKTISYYQLQSVEKKQLGFGKYFRLFFEFPFQFTKYYIFRRHIFGGLDGFVYSSALAMGRWARIFVLMGW
jgi:glycosyltransferase involved in cell wall biosynthesis